MPIKLRPIQFSINITMVADDGENLSPITVPEIVINADQISSFPAKLAEDIANQEEILNRHAEMKKDSEEMAAEDYNDKWNRGLE